MLAPNESFCVSSLAALREVSSLKSSMSKSQAEATLGSFVARGWLVKSRCAPLVCCFLLDLIRVFLLQTRTLLSVHAYDHGTSDLSAVYV